MATIELKGIYETPHNTAVFATFPFTFQLIQGSGQAEWKEESKPYGWKVDVWHDCRVTFHPSGGLGAHLEAGDFGELQIKRGHTYLFGLADEAPVPEPAPVPPGGELPAPPTPEPPEQPGPAPAPIPPVPSDARPKVITTAGYPEVTRPAAIWWGTSEYATMDLVWSVPEWWIDEAWAEVRRTLIARINEAIARGEYTVEYRVRG